MSSTYNITTKEILEKILVSELKKNGGADNHITESLKKSLKKINKKHGGGAST